MRWIIATLFTVIAVLAALLIASHCRSGTWAPPFSKPFRPDTQWTEVVPDPAIHLVPGEVESGLLLSYNVARRTITTPGRFFTAAIAWCDHGCTTIVAYEPMRTGATLIRIDDATRRIVYIVPVVGLGPIDHSQYHNRLTVFTNRDLVMIVGDETAGIYREVRRIEDGLLVLIDQHFAQGWPEDFPIRVE